MPDIVDYQWDGLTNKKADSNCCPCKTV